MNILALANIARLNKSTAKTTYLVSNGTDDTAAIQAAFDALADGDCLYIKGKLLVKGNVTLTGKKNITIRGDGCQVSQFFNSSTGEAVKFDDCYYLTVLDIGFFGNGDPLTYGTGATNGDGLQMNSVRHANFVNCEWSYNGGNGINLIDGCWILSYTNPRIIGNQLNGYVALNPTTIQAATQSFINPIIWKNVGSGILWASTNLNISGGIIEANGVGVDIDCATATMSAYSVSISGVDFETNKGGHIRMTTTAAFTVYGVSVSGCHFTDNADTAEPFIIARGTLPIQCAKFAKNGYTVPSATNKIMDLGGLAYGMCEIEVDRGYLDKFANLGAAKVTGNVQTVAINGLIEQRGIPYTAFDKSDNLIAAGSIVGYWKVPLRGNGVLETIAIYFETDATTDYSCEYLIQKLNPDGTITDGYSGSATKTGGGSGSLAFYPWLYCDFAANQTLFVKTTITKPTNGTAFHVRSMTVIGEA